MNPATLKNHVWSLVKNPRFIAAIGVAILAVIFLLLLLTGTFSSGGLKTVNYTNSKGVTYNLKFSSKYETRKLLDGNYELVSTVPKAGKYPLTMSIGLVNPETSSGVRKCDGYDKLFDVQNRHIGQKISVCDISTESDDPAESATSIVYIAGFLQDGKAHLITFSQDAPEINLNRTTESQEEMAKFGLQPYQEDIRTIVASIKVK
jgi:hypothetical protein